MAPMTTQLLVALIAILTFVFLRWLWSRRKMYQLSMKLDGPLSLPLVGSLPAAFRMAAHGNAIDLPKQYMEASSGLFGGWLGTKLFLYATNPADVEAILNASLSTKSQMVYDPWAQSMGRGLLTLHGIGKDSPWKEHKKIISPSFAANMYKVYFEVLPKRCRELGEEFGRLCDEGTVDIFRPVAKFMGETVSETMYGVKRNFDDSRNYDVVHAVETIMEAFPKRVVKFWYLFEPLYKLSRFGREQRRATVLLRRFCEDIFDERKSQNKDCTGENTVMNVLLKAHEDKLMTREDVIGEMMNLWPAAFDTTAISLTYTLLCLAMHKECQDRAFEEIEAFCEGDRSVEIEYADLSRFKYLEACIKEGLRLFASGPTTFKYNTEDFELKSRGWTIPAGTTFMFSSFLTHHDPRIWPEPYKFRPERFYDKQSADQRHPFAYYPFYGGPRKCPGRSYATMIITMATVHLLRNYEFHSDWSVEEMPLSFDVNVRCDWGYKAKITPRIWKK